MRQWLADLVLVTRKVPGRRGHSEAFCLNLRSFAFICGQIFFLADYESVTVTPERQAEPGQGE